jgi:hypothetical protein
LKTKSLSCFIRYLGYNKIKEKYIKLSFEHMLGREIKMSKNAVRSTSMERKIISVSGKRQITIPRKYFEELGFSNEAECIMQNNTIVIRPIRENTESEFSEQILADLIDQGLAGQELLVKFKEMRKKIVYAMDKIIGEADSIARGEIKGATMADIFGAEDK